MIKSRRAIPWKRQETGSSASRPPAFHISPLGGFARSVDCRSGLLEDSGSLLLGLSCEATAGSARVLPSHLFSVPGASALRPCLLCHPLSLPRFAVTQC